MCLERKTQYHEDSNSLFYIVTKKITTKDFQSGKDGVDISPLFLLTVYNHQLQK